MFHSSVLCMAGGYSAVQNKMRLRVNNIKGRGKGKRFPAMNYDMKRLIYIESAVLVSLLLVFAAATYQRNFVWKDDFSLWSDAVKKSSYKARPYNNLANACEKKGLIDQAILLAKKSIALNPNLAEPHNNLGICYLEKGWTDKAALEFKHAIRVKPNFARAYSNLGLAYSRQGQKGMAIAQHKQALEVNPYFVDAHNNLGVCYFDKGMIDKAISHFQHAINIDFNHADAHYNLGVAYGSKGKYDMAFKEMRIAKRLSSSQQWEKIVKGTKREMPSIPGHP